VCKYSLKVGKPQSLHLSKVKFKALKLNKNKSEKYITLLIWDVTQMQTTELSL
jgi:hypothetical protein